MIINLKIKAHNRVEVDEKLSDKFVNVSILDVKRKFLKFDAGWHNGYLYVYHLKVKKEKDLKCDVCNTIIRGEPCYINGFQVCKLCFKIKRRELRREINN